MLKSWIKNNKARLVILVLLPLLTYLFYINNVFLSDDLATIVQNKQIGTISGVLSHGFGFPRPLLYYLAYHLGGLNPWAFRLINLFFHIGSTLLIYTLVSKLHSKRVGLISALLFTVHPLLVEPVAWVSGGPYPQSTIFTLLSFLLYLLSKTRARLYPLALLSYFLAIGTQAIPLIFPVILALSEFCFGDLRQSWKRLLPFFGLSLLGPIIGTGGVSFAEIPQRTKTLQTVHYQQVGINNPLIEVPIAIYNYLELLFWPVNLTLYHSEIFYQTWSFLLQVLVTVTYLGLTTWAFFKSRQLFFWLSLFLLGLTVPLLSATFGLSWIVAERYAYLSSIGVIVAVVLLIDKYLGHQSLKQPIYMLLLVLLILLFIRSEIRLSDWQDEDHLWVATGKTSPSSPNTHNNLGDVYGRQGDKQKALQEFQTAISLKPNYADAYHNLANTYHELGQDDLALQNYQKAAQISPLLWQSYQNIGAIYFQRGESSKALEYIQKANTISPDNPNLKVALGIVYLKLGDKVKAKESFTQALQLDPTSQAAQTGLQESN
jgi:tetratricopeptide (TPR) repeat protein